MLPMGRNSNGAWCIKLIWVPVLLLAVFISTVRPLARASGGLNVPQGMIRMSLLTEAQSDTQAVLPAPAAVGTYRLVPPAWDSQPEQFTTRHAAYQPAPLLRLKIPPPRSTGSLLSD